MIRDVVVIDHGGVPVFAHNFGACHSFHTDVYLVSGFMSALQSLAKTVQGGEITYVGMGELSIYFHKLADYLYAVICDASDPEEATKVKVRRIGEMFTERYGAALQGFRGEVGQFDEFADVLVELKITQKNCGGRPECAGCENESKHLPLEEWIPKLRKRARLRRFFGGLRRKRGKKEEEE
ncbi:MAG: hypothetical protein ACTSU5_03410 [Promethearchaeota archaeon]